MSLRFRAALAAMIVCALAPGLTRAQSAPASPPVNLAQMTMGYTYYNRPGATLQAHNEAVAACVVEAVKTQAFDEQVGVGAGILGVIIEDALDSAYHRSSVASGLENCMVVHGWRVVVVPQAEGKALAALAPEALAAQLESWIGAETPNGTIVRTWANDATNGANTRYEIRPAHMNDGQLSLRAVTAGSLKQFRPVVTKVVPPLAADKKWPKKALKPKDIATMVPEGGAVILLHVRGLSMHNGIGVILNRMGPEPGVWPSSTDRGPDIIMGVVGLIGAKKEGNMVAVAVPPGRWRIYGMGFTPMLNFCLGAPAFEVKAGEVVYAGSFDLGSASMGPDLSLDRATTWLGEQPAAQAVRAAAYVNGTTGICGNNGIYAFEIEGAPFEPGYVGGSIPVPLASTPPTDPTPAP